MQEVQSGRTRVQGSVLSIGRLGSGSADYYLRAVAGGAEDYYLRSSEEPGRWLGGGPEGLDLEGRVGGDDLRAVLDGRDPALQIESLRSAAQPAPGLLA